MSTIHGGQPATDPTWFTYTPDGRWNRTAIEILPRGKPRFEGIPRRGYSVIVGGKIIGAMRYRSGLRKWIITIDGFEFRKEPDDGTMLARVTGKPIYSSPKAYFPALAARKAVKRVIASLPPHPA